MGPLKGQKIIEMAGIGPGPIPAISIILNPFSGPILVSCQFFFSQRFKIKNQLG